MKTFSLITLNLLLAMSPLCAMTDQDAIDLGLEPVDYLNVQETEDLSQLPAIFKDESGQRKASHKIVVNHYDLYRAPVVIVINKGIRSNHNPDGQTLKLYIDGRLDSDFNTSTGRETLVQSDSGKYYEAATPEGFFRISRAHRTYYSNVGGSNMHYALFFNSGIAIHSTIPQNYKNLGKRASDGCARLLKRDAKYINEVVRERGGNGSGEMETTTDVRGRLRENYQDRVELFDVDVNTGAPLETERKIWTYDALIIVHS